MGDQAEADKKEVACCLRAGVCGHYGSARSILRLRDLAGVAVPDELHDKRVDRQEQGHGEADGDLLA